MCVYAQTIVAWSGSKANMFERQKVREIAMLIRDTERNGKAHITDVTEGEETLEMVQVTNTCIPLKMLFESLSHQVGQHDHQIQDHAVQTAVIKAKQTPNRLIRISKIHFNLI